MPNNLITVDRTKQLGAALWQNAAQTASARDALVQLKADMDNMIAGTDYSLVESQFGLATGKGQIVYNLVAGAVSEVAANANLTNLINWLAVLRFP